MNIPAIYSDSAPNPESNSKFKLNSWNSNFLQICAHETVSPESWLPTTELLLRAALLWPQGWAKSETGGSEGQGAAARRSPVGCVGATTASSPGSELQNTFLQGSEQTLTPPFSEENVNSLLWFKLSLKSYTVKLTNTTSASERKKYSKIDILQFMFMAGHLLWPIPTTIHNSIVIAFFNPL